MPKDKKIAPKVKKEPVKEFVECPECKGKDESCSMCGGSGKVVKE
jgi:hypothetical protein